MSRKKMTGRLRIEFDKIESMATSLERAEPAPDLGVSWRLTRHSAVYRCKDGSLTLCLVWHADGMTMTRTIRGLRPEMAAA